MHHDTILFEILSILAIAIVMATLFGRLGFGAILGYLVAGIIIGPSGFNVIAEPSRTAYLGEFGITFLLFMIGLELKPARLWLMRKEIFGTGSAQVLLTGSLLSFVAFWGLEQGVGASVLIGFGLALSSTAFDLQLLTSKNFLNSRWGRRSFSILMMQDLAVVPLLALVPVLAKGEMPLGTTLLFVIAEVLVLLIGTVVVGRLVINPLFRIVATNKVPEVFTAMALFLVLVFGWAMQSMGLSMAMGAFIAGLLMAESEFRHQVEVDIRPFRGLLLGLFFMSVGMAIDLSVLQDEIELIAMILVVLLISKADVLIALNRVMNLTVSEAVKSAFLLAQAGEFGFVLFSYGAMEGVISNGLSSILVTVIALSMALTPALFYAGFRVSGRLAKDSHEQKHDDHLIKDKDQEKVVIAGFGRVGETVAFILSNLHVPLIVVDLDPEVVKKAREMGYHAIFGDALNPGILKKAGVEKTKLLVITLNDAKAAQQLLTSCRNRHPKAKIFMRSHDNSSAKAMLEIGADHVVPETMEASLALGADAAKAMDANEDKIDSIVKSLKRSDYHLLLKKISH